MRVRVRVRVRGMVFGAGFSLRFLYLQDLLVDAKGVLVVEGGVASQHLVNEDAQGPPG